MLPMSLYSHEIKSAPGNRTGAPIFTAASFIDTETAYVSVEWMDKETVVRTYNGIYVAVIKKETAICNKMDGTWRHYAKFQSNSDRERQTLYDLNYKWNLKVKLRKAENGTVVIRS